MTDSVTAVAGYEITLARPGDLSRIAPIELAAARLLEGYAPEAVLEEVTPDEDLRAAQRDGRLWVALSGHMPVGFAHVEILEPNAAHLEEIDVHPEHGRQGLGARLVRTVCQWAEARGIVAVPLATFRDVPWNMPFYARLGFEELTPAELSPALRGLLEDETRRGLDPTRRVVMRWRSLTASSRVMKYASVRGAWSDVAEALHAPRQSVA